MIRGDHILQCSCKRLLEQKRTDATTQNTPYRGSIWSLIIKDLLQWAYYKKTVCKNFRCAFITCNSTNVSSQKFCGTHHKKLLFRNVWLVFLIKTIHIFLTLCFHINISQSIITCLIYFSVKIFTIICTKLRFLYLLNTNLLFSVERFPTLNWWLFCFQYSFTTFK